MRLLDADDFRNSSRGEAVYQAVRAAIQEGELEPGERIREASIAEQLGDSRTPVREALQRLITEGLLTNARTRGVMVTDLDKHQVLELYALREVLEGAAAGFAASRATDTDLAVLRDIVDEEVLHAQSPEQLAALNRHFHRAIYAAAHHQYLMVSVNALADALNLLRGTTFSAPNRPATSHDEHIQILTAIEQRDAEAAERIARLHIREARRIRLKMLFPHG